MRLSAFVRFETGEQVSGVQVRIHGRNAGGVDIGARPWVQCGNAHVDEVGGVASDGHQPIFRRRRRQAVKQRGGEIAWPQNSAIYGLQRHVAKTR